MVMQNQDNNQNVSISADNQIFAIPSNDQDLIQIKNSSGEIGEQIVLIDAKLPKLQTSLEQTKVLIKDLNADSTGIPNLHQELEAIQEVKTSEYFQSVNKELKETKNTLQTIGDAGSGVATGLMAAGNVLSQFFITPINAANVLALELQQSLNKTVATIGKIGFAMETSIITTAIPAIVKGVQIFREGIETLNDVNLGKLGMELTGIDSQIYDSTKKFRNFSKSLILDFQATTEIIKDSVRTALPVQDVADYIKTLRNVTQGISSKQIANNLKEVAEAIDYTKTAAELALPVYDVLSAGMGGMGDNFETTTSQIVSQINKYAELTKAPQAGLQKAVIYILKAYNQGASEVSSLLSELDMMIQKGIVQAQDIENMAEVFSTAAVMGIDRKEVMMAMAQLTTKLNPNEAITALNRLLLTFVNKNPMMVKALSNLNIELDLANKGIIQTVQEINAASKGNVETIKEIARESQAFLGFSNLTQISSDQLSKLKDEFATASATGGDFIEQQWDEYTDRLDVKSKIIQNKYETLMSNIGEEFLASKTFTTGLNQIEKLLDQFLHNPFFAQIVKIIATINLSVNKFIDLIAIATRALGALLAVLTTILLYARMGEFGAGFAKGFKNAAKSGTLFKQVLSGIATGLKEAFTGKNMMLGLRVLFNPKDLENKQKLASVLTPFNILKATVSGLYNLFNSLTNKIIGFGTGLFKNLFGNKSGIQQLNSQLITTQAQIQALSKEINVWAKALNTIKNIGDKIIDGFKKGITQSQLLKTHLLDVVQIFSGKYTNKNLLGFNTLIEKERIALEDTNVNLLKKDKKQLLRKIQYVNKKQFDSLLQNPLLQTTTPEALGLKQSISALQDSIDTVPTFSKNNKLLSQQIQSIKQQYKNAFQEISALNNKFSSDLGDNLNGLTNTMNQWIKGSKDFNEARQTFAKFATPSEIQQFNQATATIESSLRKLQNRMKDVFAGRIKPEQLLNEFAELQKQFEIVSDMAKATRTRSTDPEEYKLNEQNRIFKLQNSLKEAKVELNRRQDAYQIAQQKGLSDDELSQTLEQINKAKERIQLLEAKIATPQNQLRAPQIQFNEVFSDKNLDNIQQQIDKTQLLINQQVELENLKTSYKDIALGQQITLIDNVNGANQEFIQTRKNLELMKEALIQVGNEIRNNMGLTDRQKQIALGMYERQLASIDQLIYKSKQIEEVTKLGKFSEIINETGDGVKKVFAQIEQFLPSFMGIKDVISTQFDNIINADSLENQLKQIGNLINVHQTKIQELRQNGNIQTQIYPKDRFKADTEKINSFYDQINQSNEIITKKTSDNAELDKKIAEAKEQTKKIQSQLNTAKTISDGLPSSKATVQNLETELALQQSIINAAENQKLINEEIIQAKKDQIIESAKAAKTLEAEVKGKSELEAATIKLAEAQQKLFDSAKKGQIQKYDGNGQMAEEYRKFLEEKRTYLNLVESMNPILQNLEKTDPLFFQQIQSLLTALKTGSFSSIEEMQKHFNQIQSLLGEITNSMQGLKTVANTVIDDTLDEKFTNQLNNISEKINTVNELPAAEKNTALTAIDEQIKTLQANIVNTKNKLQALAQTSSDSSEIDTRIEDLNKLQNATQSILSKIQDGTITSEDIAQYQQLVDATRNATQSAEAHADALARVRQNARDASDETNKFFQRLRDINSPILNKMIDLGKGFRHGIGKLLQGGKENIQRTILGFWNVSEENALSNIKEDGTKTSFLENLNNAAKKGTLNFGNLLKTVARTTLAVSTFGASELLAWEKVDVNTGKRINMYKILGGMIKQTFGAFIAPMIIMKGISTIMEGINAFLPVLGNAADKQRQLKKELQQLSNEAIAPLNYQFKNLSTEIKNTEEAQNGLVSFFPKTFSALQYGSNLITLLGKAFNNNFGLKGFLDLVASLFIKIPKVGRMLTSITNSLNGFTRGIGNELERRGRLATDYIGERLKQWDLEIRSGAIQAVQVLNEELKVLGETAENTLNKLNKIDKKVIENELIDYKRSLFNSEKKVQDELIQIETDKRSEQYNRKVKSEKLQKQIKTLETEIENRQRNSQKDPLLSRVRTLLGFKKSNRRIISLSEDQAELRKLQKQQYNFDVLTDSNKIPDAIKRKEKELSEVYKKIFATQEMLNAVQKLNLSDKNWIDNAFGYKTQRLAVLDAEKKALERERNSLEEDVENLKNRLQKESQGKDRYDNLLQILQNIQKEKLTILRIEQEFKEAFALGINSFAPDIFEVRKSFDVGIERLTQQELSTIQAKILEAEKLLQDPNTAGPDREIAKERLDAAKKEYESLKNNLELRSQYKQEYMAFIDQYVTATKSGIDLLKAQKYEQKELNKSLIEGLEIEKEKARIQELQKEKKAPETILNEAKNLNQLRTSLFALGDAQDKDGSPIYNTDQKIAQQNAIALINKLGNIQNQIITQAEKGDNQVLTQSSNEIIGALNKFAIDYSNLQSATEMSGDKQSYQSQTKESLQELLNSLNDVYGVFPEFAVIRNNLIKELQEFPMLALDETEKLVGKQTQITPELIKQIGKTKEEVNPYYQEMFKGIDINDNGNISNLYQYIYEAGLLDKNVKAVTKDGVKEYQKLDDKGNIKQTYSENEYSQIVVKKLTEKIPQIQEGLRKNSAAQYNKKLFISSEEKSDMDNLVNNIAEKTKNTENSSFLNVEKLIKLKDSEFQAQLTKELDTLQKEKVINQNTGDILRRYLGKYYYGLNRQLTTITKEEFLKLITLNDETLASTIQKLQANNQLTSEELNLVNKYRQAATSINVLDPANPIDVFFSPNEQVQNIEQDLNAISSKYTATLESFKNNRENIGDIINDLISVSTEGVVNLNASLIDLQTQAFQQELKINSEKLQLIKKTLGVESQSYKELLADREEILRKGVNDLVQALEDEQVAIRTYKKDKIAMQENLNETMSDVLDSENYKLRELQVKKENLGLQQIEILNELELTKIKNAQTQENLKSQLTGKGLDDVTRARLNNEINLLQQANRFVDEKIKLTNTLHIQQQIQIDREISAQNQQIALNEQINRKRQDAIILTQALEGNIQSINELEKKQDIENAKASNYATIYENLKRVAENAQQYNNLEFERQRRLTEELTRRHSLELGILELKAAQTELSDKQLINEKEIALSEAVAKAVVADKNYTEVINNPSATEVEKIAAKTARETAMVNYDLAGQEVQLANKNYITNQAYHDNLIKTTKRTHQIEKAETNEAKEIAGIAGSNLSGRTKVRQIEKILNKYEKIRKGILHGIDKENNIASSKPRKAGSIEAEIYNSKTGELKKVNLNYPGEIAEQKNKEKERTTTGKTTYGTMIDPATKKEISVDSSMGNPSIRARMTDNSSSYSPIGEGSLRTEIYNPKTSKFEKVNLNSPEKIAEQKIKKNDRTLIEEPGLRTQMTNSNSSYPTINDFSNKPIVNNSIDKIKDIQPHNVDNEAISRIIKDISSIIKNNVTTPISEVVQGSLVQSVAKIGNTLDEIKTLLMPLTKIDNTKSPVINNTNNFDIAVTAPNIKGIQDDISQNVYKTLNNLADEINRRI